MSLFEIKNDLEKNNWAFDDDIEFVQQNYDEIYIRICKHTYVLVCLRMYSHTQTYRLEHTYPHARTHTRTQTHSGRRCGARAPRRAIGEWLILGLGVAQTSRGDCAGVMGSCFFCVFVFLILCVLASGTKSRGDCVGLWAPVFSCVCFLLILCLGVRHKVTWLSMWRKHTNKYRNKTQQWGKKARVLFFPHCCVLFLYLLIFTSWSEGNHVTWRIIKWDGLLCAGLGFRF